MKHSPSHTKPQLVFRVKELKSKAMGPKTRKEEACGKVTAGLVLWARRFRGLGEMVGNLGENEIG